MGLIKEFFSRFRHGDNPAQVWEEARQAVVQEPHERWLVFDVNKDGKRTYSTPILSEALALKRAYPTQTITQRNVTIGQFDAISRNR